MSNENSLIFDSVSAGIIDNQNPISSIQIDGNILSYGGKSYDVDHISDQLEEERIKLISISKRLSSECHAQTNNLKVVFSPFNGAETTLIDSEISVATDILPIGSPKQVSLLYENKYARALYLADKLDRGHSYSGVLQKLGYLGAMLLWDIEDIQKGTIVRYSFLDQVGKQITDNDISSSGIEIEYEVAGKKRIHRQFSCSYPNLPTSIQGPDYKVDALYIRGSHGLVTMSEFFDEYKLYVSMVRESGIVVSDATLENLLWNMQNEYEKASKFILQTEDQFGYSGKKAKINLQRSQDARHGYLSILVKS